MTFNLGRHRQSNKCLQLGKMLRHQIDPIEMLSQVAALPFLVHLAPVVRELLGDFAFRLAILQVLALARQKATRRVISGKHIDVAVVSIKASTQNFGDSSCCTPPRCLATIAPSAPIFDCADRAAQFGEAAQPADRGVAGVGPLGLGEVVEHAMAVIRPEHDPVVR
jgi:hypothetical protein